MENGAVVLMLKDAGSGFMEKELGVYPIGPCQQFLVNCYGEETPQGLQVVLRCSGEGELSDKEFQDVYEHFQLEDPQGDILEIQEEEDVFYPTWSLRLPYYEDETQMAQCLQRVMGHFEHDWREALSKAKTEQEKP